MKFHSNNVFFNFFNNNYSLRKNHYHIKEEEILYMHIPIFFSFFFCLVFFYEPQTWGLMAIKKL
jgi:hypothetical protein